MGQKFCQNNRMSAKILEWGHNLKSELLKENIDEIMTKQDIPKFLLMRELVILNRIIYQKLLCTVS